MLVEIRGNDPFRWMRREKWLSQKEKRDRSCSDNKGKQGGGERAQKRRHRGRMRIDMMRWI